jgi:hypothetical protein
MTFLLLVLLHSRFEKFQTSEDDLQVQFLPTEFREVVEKKGPNLYPHQRGTMETSKKRIKQEVNPNWQDF